MSEKRSARSPLGVRFYFIDVMGCVLFCLVLTLAAARFGREESVEIDLPELAVSSSSAPGPSLNAREISLREQDGAVSVWLDGAPIGLDELAQRLRAESPPAVVVRSEASLLARVVGIAHAAGVRQIELTYQVSAPKAVAR